MVAGVLPYELGAECDEPRHLGLRVVAVEVEVHLVARADRSGRIFAPLPGQTVT